MREPSDRLHSRLSVHLRRSYCYSVDTQIPDDHRRYWTGCFHAYRITAVDLGYSHKEINQILGV